MTEQEFRQRLDRLVEEYVFGNDDYQDVRILDMYYWTHQETKYEVDMNIRKVKPEL